MQSISVLGGTFLNGVNFTKKMRRGGRIKGVLRSENNGYFCVGREKVVA